MRCKWLCCRDISCTQVNPQHFQCLHQFEIQVLLFLKEEVQHVDRLTWWLPSPTIHNTSYQDDFKVDNTSMDLLNRSHTEVLSLCNHTLISYSKLFPRENFHCSCCQWRRCSNWNLIIYTRIWEHWKSSNQIFTFSSIRNYYYIEKWEESGNVHFHQRAI